MLSTSDTLGLSLIPTHTLSAHRAETGKGSLITSATTDSGLKLRQMEVLEVQEEMLQDLAVGVDRLYRQVGSVRRGLVRVTQQETVPLPLVFYVIPHLCSALSDFTRPSLLSLLALSLVNCLSHPCPPRSDSY
jgi:hypothetical protein